MQDQKKVYVCFQFTDPAQVFVQNLNILLWNRAKYMKKMANKKRGKNVIQFSKIQKKKKKNKPTYHLMFFPWWNRKHIFFFFGLMT